MRVQIQDEDRGEARLVITNESAKTSSPCQKRLLTHCRQSVFRSAAHG